jgi:hypothetical protein
MFAKSKPARSPAEAARRAAVLQRLERFATWNRTPPVLERSPMTRRRGGELFFIRAHV